MTKVQQAKAIKLLRRVEGDLVFIANACNPTVHEKLREQGFKAWHLNLTRIRQFLRSVG